MNKIVVQKFGGTSVQDAAAMTRAMDIVAKHGVRRGLRPIVVLSACAGVTNALIRIGELALLGKFDEAHAAISALDERHFTTLHELKLPLRSEQEAALQLRFIWRELRTLLRGIELLGELTARMRDKLVSSGERASSTIFAHALREHLMPRAVPVLFADAREFFVTDSAFTSARPQTSEIAKLMKPLAKKLQSGTAIVTQGFIGATRRGETTTIGRGGSDFSASIMGVAASAHTIEIWTDVVGIYTCDPRLVPEAYPQPVMGFADASTMAFYGAKVLHPETIGPAVEAGIPVRVLSSKEPDKDGTTILLSSKDTPLVSGIAIKRNIVLASIGSGRLIPESTMLTPIFESLERNNIVPSASSISFDRTLLALDSIDQFHAVEQSVRGLPYECSALRERALVTLVGHGLEHSSGIAKKLLSAIGRTNCEMISYGGARNALSIVIPETSVEVTIRKIHAAFF